MIYLIIYLLEFGDFSPQVSSCKVGRFSSGGLLLALTLINARSTNFIKLNKVAATNLIALKTTAILVVILSLDLFSFSNAQNPILSMSLFK